MRFMTTKVRKVTPSSTGMAVRSRRPTSCRAGEPAARRAKLVRAPGPRWSWTCCASAIVVPMSLLSLPGRRSGAGRVVVDVLPGDRRRQRDRWQRTGEARAGHPLDRHVGRGEGEVERTVVVLGDVGGRLVVERAADAQVAARRGLAEDAVQLG